MCRNRGFFGCLRARARDRGLLQQGNKGGPKARQFAIRINFSALLFAKVSDKSWSEECLALGAGLRAYPIAQSNPGGAIHGEKRVRGRGKTGEYIT
jgi:hypothetical protein